jgi:hypothetical protein
MSRKEFSLEEVLTVAMDRNFVGKIGEAFALAAHLLGEKRIDGPTYGQEIAKLQQGLVKQIPQLRNYVDKLGEAQAVTTKEKAEDAARDIEMFLAKATKAVCREVSLYGTERVYPEKGPQVCIDSRR